MRCDCRRIVVIPDADHHFGRGFRKGAVTIALCIHGDSVMTGHGPGILTLMTSSEPVIEWVIDPQANIALPEHPRGVV
ncbi:MAG: DUF4438 domain-containing protein [Anaerolineae bacterium]